MCVTEQKERDVAAAMAKAFRRQQLPCETHILVADNDGLRVKRGA
jgi:hypothetical protein